MKLRGEIVEFIDAEQKFRLGRVIKILEEKDTIIVGDLAKRKQYQVPKHKVLRILTLPNTFQKIVW